MEAHARNLPHTRKYLISPWLSADYFLQTFSRSAPHVIDQLDQGRKSKIKEKKVNVLLLSQFIFCGRQGLAFRSHRESGSNDLSKPPAENTAIFRALLCMRADCRDTYLKNHLKSCPSNASYLRPDVQNQIIEICGEITQESLDAKVNAAGCFSLLADERADIAGIEQLTVCARYLNKDANDIEGVFLGFSTGIPSLIETTGSM